MLKVRAITAVDTTIGMHTAGFQLSVFRNASRHGGYYWEENSAVLDGERICLAGSRRTKPRIHRITGYLM